MRAESMGSDGLIDVKAAGVVLGLTTDMVYRLARRGDLSPRYPRGKGLNVPMHFHPEEVSACVAEREQKDFDIKKLSSRVAQTSALTRSLERRVELLETMLSRRAWPLPSDEEAVIALYTRAQDEQQDPAKAISDIMEWARVLVAMGEEYLDLTEAFTGDTECWKAFSHMVDIMLINAPVKRFNFDRELEAAYGYLDVGRRNFRAAAFFFIRNRYGSQVANQQLDAEECHAEILTIASADW